MKLLKQFKHFIWQAIIALLTKTGFYSLDNYAQASFSQMGEDIILKKIFENKKKGFYVDIGAHHPKRFSNTYIFYLKGWRGINIDAMPGSMKEFNALRSRDINLEIPVANKKKCLTYYMYNDSALNGFTKSIVEKLFKSNEYKIIETKKLKTQTLNYILDKYLPKGQKIDFITIDAQGLDYEVLTSNNWITYRPKVVVAEDIDFKIKNLEKSKIYKFMDNLNYELLSKNYDSLIFMSK